jgi:hypothetical protein
MTPHLVLPNPRLSLTDPGKVRRLAIRTATILLEDPSLTGPVGMTRAAWTALAALVGLFLAACQPSAFTYVPNSEEGVYLRFPSDWHLFESEEVLAHQFADLTPGNREVMHEQMWAIAFDADPQPDLAHVFELGEIDGYPVGFMRVRQLPNAERDQFSLLSLRNEFIPIDDILQAAPGRIEPLIQEDLTTPEGLRGVRLRFNIALNEGVFTYDQTAYVDAETRTVYLLTVGCTVECFEAHRSQIDQITESWTIKEPKV